MGGGTTNSTPNSSTKKNKSTSDLPFPVGEDVSASNVEKKNPFRNQVDQRRTSSIYTDLLASYAECPRRSVALENAKNAILSYKPGSWIRNGGGLQQSDYKVPERTTILLIGPRGSGKSSLINRISKVFDTDKFASDRAQITYHSAINKEDDGTYYLSEYTVPRNSNAFCLVDTRSLSNEKAEITVELSDLIRNGVSHGEPVIRYSDCPQKFRKNCRSYEIYNYNGGGGKSKTRRVNFVVLVVNGLSVLESMHSSDPMLSSDPEKKKYTEIIDHTFRLSELQFRDDKPVVVITHGDLLGTANRARIRIHLGELLGIPPQTQIFDIPESNNLVTELAIVDLLYYCLEHADNNLPLINYQHIIKVHFMFISAYILLLMVMIIAILISSIADSCRLRH